MPRYFQQLKLLILFLVLLLPCSPAYAGKAVRQVDDSYSFHSLQKIAVATPDLQASVKDDDTSLRDELQLALTKELEKQELYIFDESLPTQATLQITLKTLTLGELTEPAHVNWHRQNNSVNLPTADGKSSTSIDLGVSIPEFVPERKYPTVVVTALFTLTDNATGEIIYTREQERSEGNTHSPSNTLSKLVKEFHKDLSKLIKKQAK